MQDRNKDSEYSKSFKKSKGGETTTIKPSEQEPVIAQPLEVRVYNNFDKAMRTFRSLVQKERILSIYKERQSYEKPSDKKRRKRNERKRKLMELDSKFDDSKVSLKSKKDFKEEDNKY